MLGPTKKDRLINVGRDPRNGKPLYKLSYQLDRELARDSYVQFPANGPSSSLMSSGGDCLVRINRASAAWIKHVYINVQFTVATAAVTLLPMPWWFANGSGLNFYKSTDTTPFQQLFSEALIVHLNTFNSEKIDSAAYKMLCEPDLYNTLPLQTGTYNATIRIPGCWLEDMWLRDLKDDINVNLNFNSNGCVETGTATNVTVNAVSILLKQHEMTLTDESQISKMFNTGVFKKRFISYNQATSNQTLTVSAANIVLLNAIRNNVAFLFFGIRSSKSSAAGAVKKFVKLGDLNNIGTIEELDASGRTVTLLPIDSETLLRENNFEYFKGKLLSDNYPIYLIPKGHPQTSIYGIVNGFQKYTSLEQLRLTPGATTAETARQVTFLPGTLSTLTAATGGNYQIAYRKADGSSYLSASLAYNATTAAVNAAIVTMAIPNISVAASNGLNSTSGLTLTITNLSQDGSDLAVNGAQWSCIAGVYDASVALEVTTSDTQAGVTSTGFARGATNGSGSYYIDVFGATIREMTLDNGLIDVADWQPSGPMPVFR